MDHLLRLVLTAALVGGIWAAIPRQSITSEENDSFPSEEQEVLAEESLNGTKVLHQGLTTAMVKYDSSGKLVACRLFLESSDPKSKRRDLAIVDMLKPTEVDFHAMMEIVTKCYQLDKGKITPGKEPALISQSPWTLLSGIIPGTKWCGLGDIAHDYKDLGASSELDKCCRTHDHCPIRIHVLQEKFGLINFSLYTKSHCDCDEELFMCLKSLNISSADIVGNLYFNVLRVQCIEYYTPKHCDEAVDGMGCAQFFDLVPKKKLRFVKSKLLY